MRLSKQQLLNKAILALKRAGKEVKLNQAVNKYKIQKGNKMLSIYPETITGRLGRRNIDFLKDNGTITQKQYIKIRNFKSLKKAEYAMLRKARKEKKIMNSFLVFKNLYNKEKCEAKFDELDLRSFLNSNNLFL